jgi:hypothetical protein
MVQEACRFGLRILLVLGFCGLIAAAAVETHHRPTQGEIVEGLVRWAESDASDRRVFAENYAHVRTRIREERNPKGVLRDRDEQRQEHRPAASRTGDGDLADAGEPRGRAYEARDVPLSAELLARYEFEVRKRERWADREVWRVEFRPGNGGTRGKGTLDRFVSRVAGTLWLEIETLTLVRARLWLTERVSFFAGLAGMVHSLEATLERACTPEGVWYTEQSVWRVDYREFLVHKVVDFEERREDVRRVTGGREPAATGF